MLDVAAGRVVDLAPGGLHLMMHGVRAKAGDEVRLRFAFASGHVVETRAVAQAAGEADPFARMR